MECFLGGRQWSGGAQSSVSSRARNRARRGCRGAQLVRSIAPMGGQQDIICCADAGFAEDVMLTWAWTTDVNSFGVQKAGSRQE